MTETGVSGGYTYDDNGNVLTKAGDTTYTWDVENRLLGVAKVGGPTVAHVYDADGTRVRTTVTPPGGPAAVTNFLVDTSGSLSHVVAETNGAGTLKAYYVRADDLLAVMRPLFRPLLHPPTGRSAMSTPTASGRSAGSRTRTGPSPMATPTPPSASS